MRPSAILVIACGALTGLVFAQEPAPSDSAPPPAAEAPAPPPAPGTVSSAGSSPPAAAGSSWRCTTSRGWTTCEDSPPPSVAETPAPADAQGAREIPLDSAPFDVRVRHRLEDYSQRHQEREHQMAEYDKAGSTDPSLARFADPRKVQTELSDELDREQTSEELAGDYAERVHQVESREQALQDFIAKRRQTLGDLGKQKGAVPRQDLEVALKNLANQPESPEALAEMREIDGRLSEADRNEKDLPARLSQAQQEAADAEAELAKLKALAQSYQKESKTFTADALSARQNRLRLAGRLEYYVVRSQAEDELDEGQKAIEAAQHLPASPEVESTLKGSVSSAPSDADLERLRNCIQQSGDVKACREKAHQE